MKKSVNFTTVPATCVHCSAGCFLEYEKNDGDKEIYRVKNNLEFNFLCDAGRFAYDFDSKGEKNPVDLVKTVDAIENAKAIRFSSMITNEEAYMLGELKVKYGMKLFNEDARLFSSFMESYSSVSGKKHHSGSLDAIKQAEAAIVLGTRITTDNPAVEDALKTAARDNAAKIVYAHPLEDVLMKNTATQFMKHEVGAEEGVIALLADTLLKDIDLADDERIFFDDLDVGYLSAESNIGEEELSYMMKTFKGTNKRILIIGSDIMAHKRANNIAKLAALIEKYTDFSLLVVPSEVNTLGVSLINDLDIDEDTLDVVGYNAHGNYVISSLAFANLTIPALNQQKGTFVSVDNRVLPTNAPLAFDGYTLNDVVDACGIKHKNTIDCTKELSPESGFKTVEFNSLENSLTPDGDDNRGYLLDEVTCKMDGALESIEDLPEFNGTVIYHSNPVVQFNAYTNTTKELKRDTSLRGSAQFASAAKISDGDKIEISLGYKTILREFKLDQELKGTIALNPTFDIAIDSGSYKYEKSKIMRVTND